MGDNNDQGALANAEAIIERFGGIRPMASKMSVPVTTVQGWKKRNVIPENRRDDVIRAASLNDIDISDLTEKGAANENGGFIPPAAERGFERAMQAASGHRDDAFDPDDGDDTDEADDGSDDRDDDIFAAPASSSSFSSPATSSPAAPTISRPSPDVPLTAAQPARPTAQAPAPATAIDADTIRRDIIAAERRAVRKSLLMSSLLILALGGLGGMFLMTEITDNRGHIAALEGKTASLDRRMGLLEQGRNAVAAVIPEEVQQKLSGLEDQITTLSQQIQSGPGGGIVVDTANQIMPRLSALEAQVAHMVNAGSLSLLLNRLTQMQQSNEGQQQLSGAAHDLYTAVQGAPADIAQALGQVLPQSATLGEAVKGLDPAALKSAALAIGLADLNASLGRSAPFDEDMQLLTILMGDSMPAEVKAAIEQLAPQAKQGVLTPDALADQLKALAPAIVSAGLEGQNVTLKEKALARLNELVQVSKGGQLVSGTDSQAEISRAQALLEKGDVAGAVAELQNLHGSAQNTAKPFIDAAGATLAAERVQASIQSSVSTLLGVGGAPLTTQDAGLQALVHRIGNMAPGPGLVTDKASGFAILPQQH